MTDPNGNRTAVAYDGLGVPVKTAVMGKVGEGDGDTLDDPTTQLDYDLFAYATGGAATPNYVHEQAREQHGAANPLSRESYTYFDGTGRVAPSAKVVLRLTTPLLVPRPNFQVCRLEPPKRRTPYSPRPELPPVAAPRLACDHVG